MSLLFVEEGLAALRDGDAAAARRAFEQALAEVESGEALEGLAAALYFEREYSASAAHYERAYSAYRRERENLAASRAAGTAAGITGNVLGDWAVQSGWFARARTILEEAGEDRPEHGWLLIIRAYSEPDAQVREALLREAIAIGRRFGDPDIEFGALSYLGGLFIITDRVEEGLVFFDEALATACAGELTDFATVDSMFCGFFWACELVNDVPRADQWMRAAADLMKRRNVVAARGQTALARDLLERSTAGPDEEVPTIGESTMVGPMLALLVDVHLEQGNIDDAARIARRLGRVAEARRGPVSEGCRRAREGAGLHRQRAGGRARLLARGIGGVRAGAVADGACEYAPGDGARALETLP